MFPDEGIPICWINLHQIIGIKFFKSSLTRISLREKQETIQENLKFFWSEANLFIIEDKIYRSTSSNPEETKSKTMYNHRVRDRNKKADTHI